MSQETLALACFAAAALIGLGLVVAPIDRSRARASAQGSPRAADAASVSVAGAQPCWFRVLDAGALITVCKLGEMLRQLERESRLPAALWRRDIVPAITRYLEFVQLMPASEAHHHANVGGLGAHALETVSIALRLRNAMLLPTGASAEAIDAQRDHWTYAVVLAALLHDVGKPVSDLRVELVERVGAPARRWLPLTGDLRSAGAVEYLVAFAPKDERDYAAHRRLPLVLTQRIVPASALAFVARQPAVMTQLSALLAGEADEKGESGALQQIVRQADRASSSANLRHAPQWRFATATATPLVERLDQAMRQLLAEGRLPLNRDGAAGWVSEASIWFVAKRLADTVREQIQQSDPAGAASVPGATKNDRLFDAWQDYGMLERNPQTGRAVWHVRIEGPGYRHELAVLRFALAKLYPQVSQHPAAFEGTVTVLAGRGVDEEGDAASTTEAEPGAASGPKKQAPRRGRAQAIPAPRAEHERARAEPANAEDSESVPGGGPAALGGQDEDLLDDAETASAESRRNAKPASRARPVVPYVEVPALAGEDAVGESAAAFMSWLQRGVGDGSIAYNQPRAMVHFVAQGMLLVSPRVFREFAAAMGAAGSEDGVAIQREVLRARWHLVGAGRTNIHAFAVLGRGGVKAGKLSAVIIEHPERWFNPVPPTNPCIHARAELEGG